LKPRNGGLGALEVLFVPGRAPRVEIGLENLGAEEVVPGGDVEAVLRVKVLVLFAGRVTAGVVTVGGFERENFWADTGSVGERMREGYQFCER
jgi:hypothetical protein